MRYIELLETAETDLEKLRIAKDASIGFSGWLKRENSDVPLGKIPAIWHLKTNAGGFIWAIEAKILGLNDYKNLFIGFGYRPTFENGDFPPAYTTTAGHNNEYVMLIFNMASNPDTMTDIRFQTNWDCFVHEFTHVIDYYRGYLKHRARLKPGFQQSKRNYYNSPIEFNGYFQQGIDKVISQFSRFAFPDERDLKIHGSKEKYMDMMKQHYREMSFKYFLKFNKRYFNFYWLESLNAENKKRFTKRLYKIFAYVKQKWPDVAAIQDYAAESGE